MFVVERRHARNQFIKTRQVVARGAGKISAAKERGLVRRQKHGQRPAAVFPGQHVMRGLVNLIQIGPLFAVHLDIDEVRVHQRGGCLILERLMGHDVAPVAGGIADGQQDGLVLPARKGERFLTPRMPIHRIVGMLLKVKAGFLGEMVGHDRLGGTKSKSNITRTI